MPCYPDILSETNNGAIMLVFMGPNDSVNNGFCYRQLSSETPRPRFCKPLVGSSILSTGTTDAASDMSFARATHTPTVLREAEANTK